MISNNAPAHQAAQRPCPPSFKMPGVDLYGASVEKENSQKVKQKGKGKQEGNQYVSGIYFKVGYIS